MSKHIILGVTGSIAAYKSVELLRLMQKREWEVTVVMTKGATEFVTELTFRTLSRNPVHINMFENNLDWHPEHISLADKCDVMVVAPCTANVMAKLTHGISDDILSCTALATNAPIIIAPAMNTNMWNNAATQDNYEKLKSRGVNFVSVDTGELACGTEGCGRLAPLEDIMNCVSNQLKE